MSCDACEQVQEHVCDDEDAPRSYVRVGRHNVELVGCEEAVTETIAKLRAANPEPSARIEL